MFSRPARPTLYALYECVSALILDTKGNFRSNVIWQCVIALSERTRRTLVIANERESKPIRAIRKDKHRSAVDAINARGGRIR